VKERLRTEVRDSGVTYSFLLSGSTCSNIGRAIEVVMIVTTDTNGRIRSAWASPASGDRGCDAMCAAEGDGARFLRAAGQCDEAIGLTLAQAAFREWNCEPSGCFCTAGNRRHKWRNVFQALHFAVTRAEEFAPTSP
jgi:hypothetical protein